MGARTDSIRQVLAGEADHGVLARESRTFRVLIGAAIVQAHLIGAAIVVVLLSAVLPLPNVARNHGFGGTGGVGAVTAAAYVVAAVAVGMTVGQRRAQRVVDFFRSEREPTEADRRTVLRLPWTLFQMQALLWGVAALLFGGLALATSPLYGFEVTITVVLAGIPTSSMAYLVTQRLLRGGTAVVLAQAPPRHREVPGVAARSLLAWSLGAVPVGGVLALAGFAPFTDMTLDALARSVAVLGAVSVLVGLAAARLVGRSVADPLQRLRDAFADVQEGHFDVHVPVFDATEVGYAAASFNQMTAGLAERERLRDLFGRQVGGDVARQALEQGVTLGGEERTAAALFVDVIGSTTFAADRSPTEVVDALNEFFDAVVSATVEHGGLVNKFIGDAALCVFGAPLDSEDPAGAALAAAVDMARRLRGNVLDAGIGVSFGTVVAGNVGTAQRYEYTVIGDPVNEAARITDLAKQRDGRVLASMATVDAAGEAARWRKVEEVTVRGRTRPTVLAEPSETPDVHDESTTPPDVGNGPTTLRP